MNDDSQKSTTLKFAADCTIYEAAEHYQKVIDAINEASIVELDLSDVENVDSSFIQLLVSMQLEAKRNETKLEVKADSEAVNDLAAHIYCQDLLAGAENDTKNGGTDHVV